MKSWVAFGDELCLSLCFTVILPITVIADRARNDGWGNFFLHLLGDGVIIRKEFLLSIFERLQITILKALYGDPTEGELKPQISLSGGYNRWFTFKGDNTCKYCENKNGSVFLKNERVLSEEGKGIPPVHNNCKCIILPLLAMLAGTATVDTILGVDYYLKHKGVLPDNYVDKDYAKSKGWKKKKGNLRDVIKNGTMGGDTFENDIVI